MEMHAKPLFSFSRIFLAQKRKSPITAGNCQSQDQIEQPECSAVLRILNLSISHIFLSVKGKDNIHNVEDNTTKARLQPERGLSYKNHFSLL
jgi:hypothetical protein